MTLPLLPGAPEPLRCANPFCRKVLKHPGPGGYGPECARQRGLTPPAGPGPTRWEQHGPDLFDTASDVSTEFHHTLHSADQRENPPATAQPAEERP